MFYTKPMCDLLKTLRSPEAVELLSYYLDRYFTTYEEPHFSSSELKQAWYLLLTHGLLAEISREGEHSRSARIMLKELLNANSSWYLEGHDKPPITIDACKEQRERVKRNTIKLREFREQRRRHEDLQEQEQERI